MNDEAWFNEDCVNEFHNKQNTHHFLWEDYVVQRRHAQSVLDAVLLEYNNIFKK